MFKLFSKKEKITVVSQTLTVPSLFNYYYSSFCKNGLTFAQTMKAFSIDYCCPVSSSSA